MKHEIKMIALDLDGTLLRNNKAISDYSKEIIQKCRKKGIKVIFATAHGTTDDIAPYNLFDGCVKKSGAAAYDGDTLMYQRVMPIEDIRELLLACDKAGLKTAVQRMDDKTHYANFNVSAVWPHITYFKTINFTEIHFDVDKVYAITETPEAVNTIKSNLPKGVYLFASRDNLTFISHEEAIKSKATAALAEHWGIKQAEIVGFGDDVMDIDLLQYCGVGIAMGNALEEVKAAADYICDTNENDGAAKWIEEHVL